MPLELGSRKFAKISDANGYITAVKEDKRDGSSVLTGRDRDCGPGNRD
jgi:hypothetical protein